MKNFAGLSAPVSLPEQQASMRATRTTKLRIIPALPSPTPEKMSEAIVDLVARGSWTGLETVKLLAKVWGVSKTKINAAAHAVTLAAVSNRVAALASKGAA